MLCHPAISNSDAVTDIRLSTVFASHTQGSRNDPNPRLRKLYNREISERREKGKTFLATKEHIERRAESPEMAEE